MFCSPPPATQTDCGASSESSSAAAEAAGGPALAMTAPWGRRGQHTGAQKQANRGQPYDARERQCKEASEKTKTYGTL